MTVVRIITVTMRIVQILPELKKRTTAYMMEAAGIMKKICTVMRKVANTRLVKFILTR